MRKHAGLQPTTDKRLPPISERHREVIDEYLTYMASRVSRSIDAGRKLLTDGASATTMGQQLYWEHQLQTIRWMQSINQQRRSNA